MCEHNRTGPDSVRWDDGSTPVKKPGIDILKIHTGDEKTVMVLSEELLVAWVHWRGDKSYPCAPVGCQVCARGPDWKPRRQGWLAVQTRSPRKYWMLSFTPGAVEQWRKLYAPGECARGAIMSVTRRGHAVKGRMYVSIDPHAQWQVTPFGAPNVEEVLRVMWESPLRLDTALRQEADRAARKEMRNPNEPQPAKPVDLRDAGLEEGLDSPFGGAW